MSEVIRSDETVWGGWTMGNWEEYLGPRDAEDASGEDHVEGIGRIH